MKLTDIFEEKPKRWGFRGDPYFLDYLKERAAGMSSGGVDNEWWMNTGIPLLKSRLRALTE